MPKKKIFESVKKVNKNENQIQNKQIQDIKRIIKKPIIKDKKIKKSEEKIKIKSKQITKKDIIQKKPFDLKKFSNKIIKKPILKNKEMKRPEEKIKLKKQSSDKDIVQKKYSDLEKGFVEGYEIVVDKAKVKIEIRKEGSMIKYNLFVPKLNPATASLLNEIRNELVSSTTISIKEIIDPKEFNKTKIRFMSESADLLKKKIPTISKHMEEFLIGKLIQDMLGLGNIEFLINDPNLEEIVIPTSKEVVRVYHKKYGWILTNVIIKDEKEILNYSNIIARRVGRQITVLNPLLDAHLVSGDRVNAILYPVSTKGNTITIRKFSRDPYTVVDLINNKTIDLNITALLWLAIEYEMNVLISGGTASGKTVMLNAFMPFIPPNHRIISVEDTRELMLPDFLYWTPLITRIPNPEGKGEVSMLDLLINSLRMRPDRIILGEMRRQEEAMVLFEAMHTGHSVYATLHADSSAETINRLTNPPLNVPANLLKAVNLNVVMFRDRRKGIRRVLQISEFLSQGDTVSANILYRWVPEEDKIIEHSESSHFFESITRNTGMSQKELKEDLKIKMDIISWLIKNNIRDLDHIGKVINLYYSDKEQLLTSIRKNDVKKILEI